MQIITNQFQKELKNMEAITFPFWSVISVCLNTIPILLCGTAIRKSRLLM